VLIMGSRWASPAAQTIRFVPMRLESSLRKPRNCLSTMNVSFPVYLKIYKCNP